MWFLSLNNVCAASDLDVADRNRFESPISQETQRTERVPQIHGVMCLFGLNVLLFLLCGRLFSQEKLLARCPGPQACPPRWLASMLRRGFSPVSEHIVDELRKLARRVPLAVGVGDHLGGGSVVGCLQNRDHRLPDAARLDISRA
jgi:hypothetical protein